jgi:predicted metal-dependent hydrolase
MQASKPPTLITPKKSDCVGSLPSKAIEGLELFNRGRYWEAHEALEATWRAESGPVRELYRGVLQAGVVYLHITRQNYAGAMKVYRRSQKWLTIWPETCRGIAIGQLQKDLQRAILEVQALGPDRIAEFDLSLLKPVSYKTK